MGVGGYLSEECGDVCSSFVCIVAFWHGVNLVTTGDFRLGEVKVTLCFLVAEGGGGDVARGWGMFGCWGVSV